MTRMIAGALLGEAQPEGHILGREGRHGGVAAGSEARQASVQTPALTDLGLFQNHAAHQFPHL